MPGNALSLAGLDYKIISAPEKCATTVAHPSAPQVPQCSRQRPGVANEKVGYRAPRSSCKKVCVGKIRKIGIRKYLVVSGLAKAGSL